MAQNLTGVTLTAPSSDPDIAVGGTFTFSCTYTVAGHGGEEDVTLNWRASTTSGGPYTNISTSDVSTLSVTTNPTTGSDSTVTHSVTVTGDGADTYYLNVRATAGGGARDFNNGNQAATVSDTVDTLTADNVESASELTSPVIGQTHVLAATDVESASEVTAPSLGQKHVLTAVSVESASELTAPTASESHILLADSVESASEVTSPAIGQAHGLLADSVESATELTLPALGQIHVISADNVESASEVSAPALGAPPIAKWVDNRSVRRTPSLRMTRFGRIR